MSLGVEEEPLGPDEVLVTHTQFQQLALLAERQSAGAITQGEAAAEMLKVCQDLTPYRVNKLVVRLPRPHSW